MIIVLLEEYGKLNMHVYFISSRDAGETRIYHVWSDNVSIMQGKDTDDINRNF